MFHGKETPMYCQLLRSGAAGCALLSFTLSAAAQQQPGTNVPTPAPSEAGITVTPGAQILEEPVIDPRTYRSSVPNTPLLVTGLVMFGASYGASAIAGSVSNRGTDDNLYYPVVGPWMALDERDCSTNACSNKTLHTALLVGSGVVQGLGVLGMAMSLFIPQTTTEEWYLIGDSSEPHLLLAPVAGPNELGAVALGRF